MIQKREFEHRPQIKTIKIPLTGYNLEKFPDLFKDIHFDEPFLLICDRRINPIFVKKIQDVLRPKETILYDKPGERPIIGDRSVLYFEIE